MTAVQRKPLRTLVMGCVLAISVSGVLSAPAHAEPTAAELADQINTSSEELEKVVEAYNKIGEQLKVTRADAAKLSVQLQPAQAKVDAARARLSAAAAEAYKGKKITNTTVLLTAESPATLLDQITMLNQFARTQQQDLASFKLANTQVAGEKAKIDAVLTQQTAQEQQLAAQKAKITKDVADLKVAREKAFGTPPPATTIGLPAPHLAGTAGKAVDFAYSVVGRPYIFGAAGPDGYDCSGLTLAAWRGNGASLPHNASMQFDATARISRAELLPGDLVFSNGLGHVGLYVGNNQVIHAPTSGQNVKLVSIDQMGSIVGYGRVRV